MNELIIALMKETDYGLNMRTTSNLETGEVMITICHKMHYGEAEKFLSDLKTNKNIKLEGEVITGEGGLISLLEYVLDPDE